MSGQQGRMIVDCTYMTLDAGNKQLVGICLRVLNEVGRSLLCGNSDEGNTLVSGFEPDDLGALDGTTRLIALVALPLTTLSLLLLLRGSRRRPEEPKGAGEQLSRHALDHRDDMTSELRLDLIGYPGEVY